MDGGAGFSSLTPAIVRFFYLKQVTSYATVSSMVLVLHDYCECFVPSISYDSELKTHFRSCDTRPRGKIAY